MPPDFPKKLSAPLLVHPAERWVESDTRILVVGQETNGWGAGTESDKSIDSPPVFSLDKFLEVGNSIDVLLRGYLQFEFALNTPYYGSPFWRAFREFRTQFDRSVDGIESSVLWTNIFRMNIDGVKGSKSGSVYNNTTWDEFYKVQELNRHILSKEIEILKPEAIVFFTGPNYDIELEAEFQGVSFQRFGDREVRTVALLEHEDFSDAVALRAYHPNYLQMSGQWAVIDEIKSYIANNISN